ncbi:MAG: hypothetical protein OEW19_15765 [Acidobacteriota bacterium]|nr:hypothetical protein [Acidobacteriota bacterium]
MLAAVVSHPDQHVGGWRVPERRETRQRPIEEQSPGRIVEPPRTLGTHRSQLIDETPAGCTAVEQARLRTGVDGVSIFETLDTPGRPVDAWSLHRPGKDDLPIGVGERVCSQFDSRRRGVRKRSRLPCVPHRKMIRAEDQGQAKCDGDHQHREQQDSYEGNAAGRSHEHDPLELTGQQSRH